MTEKTVNMSAYSSKVMISSQENSQEANSLHTHQIQNSSLQGIGNICSPDIDSMIDQLDVSAKERMLMRKKRK